LKGKIHLKIFILKSLTLFILIYCLVGYQLIMNWCVDLLMYGEGNKKAVKAVAFTATIVYMVCMFFIWRGTR
jgi:hypothetical protein